jgi:hypothetical protein
MTWDGAGTSGGDDIAAYDPGPGGTSGGVWLRVGSAIVVLAVVVAAVVWFIRGQTLGDLISLGTEGITLVCPPRRAGSARQGRTPGACAAGSGGAERRRLDRSN